ncbi:MAG TPA: AbrB/MazE/SpoVT family DNA-binding domain-containing protein [Galbitalea sp.]|jgi:AbrB family looped-hinge helix DNA binding protein|nr:AbrB/MazE/SpoVT family DNA-binding domain-containing protein [Galbitalea sp.]
MGAGYSAKVGNKGRVVIPAGLRESRGWTDDTVLVFLEDGDGARVIARKDLLASIRRQLAGTDPVGDLIAERRAAAALEDLT